MTRSQATPVIKNRRRKSQVQEKAKIAGSEPVASALRIKSLQASAAEDSRAITIIPRSDMPASVSELSGVCARCSALISSFFTERRAGRVEQRKQVAAG